MVKLVEERLKEISTRFEQGLLSKKDLFELLNDEELVIRKFALSIIKDDSTINNLHILVEKIEDSTCISEVAEIIYELINRNQKVLTSDQKDMIRSIFRPKLFEKNIDEDTRVHMIKALSSLNVIEDLNIFRKLLNDSSSKIRLNSIKALGQLRDTKTILNSLNDTDEIRLECLRYLIAIKYPGLKKIAEREFSRGSLFLKREFIKLIGDEVWIPGIDILYDGINYPDLQEFAADALGQMNLNEEVLEILLNENETTLTTIENVDIIDRNFSPRYLSSLVNAIVRFDDQRIFLFLKDI